MASIVENNELLVHVGHICVSYDRLLLVWGGYFGTAFEENQHHIHEQQYHNPRHLFVIDTETDLCFRIETDGLNGMIPPATSAACGIRVDDDLFVFGGFKETNHHCTSQIYKLDLKDLHWRKISCSKRPTPRNKHAGWHYNRKLYYFGGYGPQPLSDTSLKRFAMEFVVSESEQSDDEDFDFEAEIRMNFDEPQSSGAYQFLNDAGSFLSDPADRSFNPIAWNNQLVVFDFRTQTWSNPKCYGDIPSPRAAHAIASHPKSGKEFLFGGRCLNQRLDDLFVFDCDSLTWTRILTDRIPEGRTWHSFWFSSDDLIVMYGGLTTQGIPLSDCWSLNSTNLEWSQLSYAPSDRPRLWHSGISASNGLIYVIGGCLTNITSRSWNQQYASGWFTIQTQPLSLKHLAMSFVISNGLPIEILPENLQKKVQIAKEPKNFPIASLKDLLTL